MRNSSLIYKYVTPALSASNATGNLSAINSALAAQAGTDVGVYIPSGRWPYNGEINNNSALLFGEDDSVLVGSDGSTSPLCNVNMAGQNPSIRWLTVEIVGATVRSSQFDHNGITFYQCRGGAAIGVTVIGAASIGIHNYGSVNCRVDGCKVYYSLADGISFTGSATKSEATGCYVKGAGDDLFSVVSYAGKVCSTININNFVAEDQRITGRGVTVIGGTDVTYRAGIIRNSQFRGITIASETTYQTEYVDGVLLKDIVIDGTGLNGVNADPGAAGIFVYGRTGYTVANVKTENVRVVSSTGPKTKNLGNSSAIDFTGVI